MSQKRQAQVPDVELQQEHSQDEESTNKRARGAEGKEQQQDPGLDLDCKDSMNLPPPPPPPQDDDPIITQFKPVRGQWELTDENIKRIDPYIGQTILHKYCRYINTTPLEVWRYLIETKGCDVNAQDKDKNTPLHNALLNFNLNKGGDITVLTYLLSQEGIDPNIKGQWGHTLLHSACEKINKLPLEISKLLIETIGFGVNAQDDNNDTPLHRAFRYFDPNDDTTVLMCLLTQTNIDVNTKGYNGDTLLHIACNNINTLPLDIFKVLIETMGCDVNAKDDDNNTPIQNALCCFDPDYGGDIKALTYLIDQNNVNVNIKTPKGDTLLHLACRHINKLPLDIFKVL
jgi:ankyrin repeat protein